MSGRPRIGTYEVHLPKGIFACESCTKVALANSPATAYAYRATERHDCELRFEGVCDDAEDRDDWVSLADEMNDPDVGPWVEGDWDPDAVSRARRYAERSGRPFPPGPGDYDRWYEEEGN